jgi:hypothetical protein
MVGMPMMKNTNDGRFFRESTIGGFFGQIQMDTFENAYAGFSPYIGGFDIELSSGLLIDYESQSLKIALRIIKNMKNSIFWFGLFFPNYY